MQQADEPLWLPDDQDKVIAFRRWESELCSRCGTHESDWLDADKRPIWPPPYEVEDHRCPGCEPMDKARRKSEDSKRNTDGLSLRLVPSDPLDYSEELIDPEAVLDD